MPTPETFPTEVLWNGKRHTVTVRGSYNPSFAFGLASSGARGGTPLSVRLRFTCARCDGQATFTFDAPSSAWRRPFSIIEVVHHDEP